MGVDARLELDLRPAIGMQHVVALPLVCSMGISDALEGSFVFWPRGVVDAQGELLAEPLVSVAYDEGLVVHVSVSYDKKLDAKRMETALQKRVASWAELVVGKQGKAGPLAPVLSELFDRVWLVGKRVACVYPNGREFTQGRFAGMDIWGRVSVVSDSGQELEFSAEQARIKELPE